MGKIELSLSESRARSVLSTLDNEVTEVKAMEEDAEAEGNERVRSRLSVIRARAESNFKIVARKINRQVEYELADEDGLHNSDLLE